MFRGRVLTLILAVAAVCLVGARAEAQYNPPPAPGPYYFVSDQLDTTAQFYARGVQVFGGVKTIENLNLLAAVLGDDASALVDAGQTLVAPESFDFGGGTVQLQSYAFTNLGSTKKLNLPIGPALRAFLNDPLGGAKFDLTLPINDTHVALSDRSAIIRGGKDASVWHTAVDLDYTGESSHGFDVVAPADGVVEGTTVTSSSLAIRHTASNGKHFLTIYQHMVPASKSALSNGTHVVRGQVLGHVQEPSGYTHLHFGVAVQGPARTINGVAVPAMWYLIDPFGVYDYRRNSGSATAYNYLPNNSLLSPARGVIHASVWRTDPVIGSLLVPEDCLGFDPANLTVSGSGSLWRILDGSHALFSFPTQTEANTAVAILRAYHTNRSCFVGRPDPSFTYVLVNGQSPSGVATGEDCVSFDPATLAIQPLSDGRFRMVSGTQSLFVFPNMLEAGNTLSTIRKYGFRKTCFVGRPDASLQYARQ